MKTTKKSGWWEFTFLVIFLVVGGLTLFPPTGKLNLSEEQNFPKDRRTEFFFKKGFVSIQSNGIGSSTKGELSNYAYFKVEPEQKLEYIYEDGDSVVFVSKKSDDLIQITNKDGDSIGTTLTGGDDLAEPIGGKYYKIYLKNKNSKMFGAGIIKH